jgi:hypothetical protein
MIDETLTSMEIAVINWNTAETLYTANNITVQIQRLLLQSIIPTVMLLEYWNYYYANGRKQNNKYKLIWINCRHQKSNYIKWCMKEGVREYVCMFEEDALPQHSGH